MFFGEEIFKEGVYFIGIGGVSMSALARLLRDHGVLVRGSDEAESGFTRQLEREGISVHIGSSEEITERTVVCTGAIGETHAQLASARRAGKTVLSRAELLGIIAVKFPCVVSVAGCHGKTTTTCMLAHIFKEAGAPFTAHIGGEDCTFGNYHAVGEKYFLTEACEFRRSFLSLKSDIAIVLNCDRDHTDCYKGEEELLEAYLEFAEKAQTVVVNVDDLRARSIPHTLDFGLHSGRIRAEKLSSFGEKYAFTVSEDDVPVVRVRLNVVGKVHVYNALAAYAAARLAGLSGEEIRRGLESFTGVRRRFEAVGKLDGVPVVCDYAHHPREIAATIDTAERLCRGTVRLVFQPHTYTRTRDFLEEFVDVLKRTEEPIIYHTYSAREKFDYAGSAVRLAGCIKGARYVQTHEGLRARLTEKLEKDDLILVLGAGDIYDIIMSILD